MITCALLVILSCGKYAALLNAASATAAYTDTWSTQRQPHPIRELNPLARPFMTHGQPVAYLSATAGTLGLRLLAYKMHRSNNRVIKKMWWLPQVAVIGANSFGIRHSLRSYHRGER